MGWFKVEDILPGVGKSEYDKYGYPDGVFALWRNKPDCGHRATVTSLQYFANHVEEFTHWMAIPRLPDAPEPPLTQDELKGLRELLKRACL